MSIILTGFFLDKKHVCCNKINNQHLIYDLDKWLCKGMDELFYHDVDKKFWPQPIRLLKLGHVTGRGCMSPTLVGRVSDLGKNGFHKKCKNLDNIAVYLTAHLE